jgi:hypothetical protein
MLGYSIPVTEKSNIFLLLTIKKGEISAKRKVKIEDI